MFLTVTCFMDRKIVQSMVDGLFGNILLHAKMGQVKVSDFATVQSQERVENTAKETISSLKLAMRLLKKKVKLF